MADDVRAFWSYVHADDEDDDGGIIRLSERLKRRMRILTGESFPIFLDKDSIQWGAEWESEIETALLSTTFFIPIVTPSYVKSSSCRKELLRFSSSARSLGLDELILPIIYVPSPTVTDGHDSEDEVVRTIRRHQWRDLSAEMLEDIGSSVYRKAINELAEQIIELADRANAKPTLRPPGPGSGAAPDGGVSPPGPRPSDEPSSPDAPGEPPPENGDGLIEILAEGEAALPRLTQETLKLSPLIDGIGRAMTEATAELKIADDTGKGFAGRLSVARGLSKTLDGFADDLEPIVVAFLDELGSCDLMVLTVLRILRENPSQISGASEFLDSTDTAALQAAQALGEGAKFVDQLRSLRSVSKDLRKPISRLESGFMQINDAVSIFEKWHSEISALRADNPPISD